MEYKSWDNVVFGSGFVFIIVGIFNLETVWGIPDIILGNTIIILVAIKWARNRILKEITEMQTHE